MDRRVLSDLETKLTSEALDIRSASEVGCQKCHAEPLEW